MAKVTNPISNPIWHLTTVDFGNSVNMINVAEKHWQKKVENLWIGDIDKSYFTFQINAALLRDIPADSNIKIKYIHDRLSYLLKGFFHFKYYKFDIETIDVDKGTIPELEQTCKLCYLLNEWLKEKSFRDPVCTHYNPRLGEQVVHPGGTRQIILDLFQTTPVKTFYFNTGGVEFDFLSNLKKISLEELIEQHYSVNLVPDHGTLIPHILNVGSNGTLAVPTNMIRVHNRYKAKLTNPDYKISSNIRISYLEKWATTNLDEASVVINFKKSPADISPTLKATLLTLSGDNYEDDDLSIIHRNII